MARAYNNRGRTPIKPESKLDTKDASERLLTRLTGCKACTPLPLEIPEARRYRAKCRRCKDVGRVKTPGTIGMVEPCPECDAAFVPDPKRAEGIIDSVLARPRRLR